MIENLEKARQSDLTIHKRRVEETNADKEKAELALAMLKEEMMEQSRKYTETIEIMEN